jgi:hypothetical protein
MLIDLPCSRCGRSVWLAWSDDLDAVASDSPHRSWPYVCRNCQSQGARDILEEPPC